MAPEGAGGFVDYKEQHRVWQEMQGYLSTSPSKQPLAEGEPSECIEEDTLTLDIINKAIELAKSTKLGGTPIVPWECFCGKHKVYWVYSHPDNKEQALDLLSQDPEHIEFMKHISTCVENEKN